MQIKPSPILFLGTSSSSPWLTDYNFLNSFYLNILSSNDVETWKLDTSLTVLKTKQLTAGHKAAQRCQKSSIKTKPIVDKSVRTRAK